MSFNVKLGEKVTLLREKSDMSTEQLAKKAGVDILMVQQIENGELVPFLTQLIKISRALGVRLGTLLDDQEHIGPVITKNDDLQHVKRFRGSSSDSKRNRVYYSLAFNKHSRHMEPLLLELAPSDDYDNKKSSHEGEEFIYVLEGDITVEYGKEKYSLLKGESIYFDAIIEHDVKAKGKNPAKILAVIHEPF